MKDESSSPVSICPVCQKPLAEGLSVHEGCSGEEEKIKKEGTDIESKVEKEVHVCSFCGKDISKNYSFHIEDPWCKELNTEFHRLKDKKRRERIGKLNLDNVEAIVEAIEKMGICNIWVNEKTGEVGFSFTSGDIPRDHWKNSGAYTPGINVIFQGDTGEVQATEDYGNLSDTEFRDFLKRHLQENIDRLPTEIRERCGQWYQKDIAS